MSESVPRDQIFSAKTGEQIGYVRGAAAYDLKNRKRYDLDADRNLIDPATGQVVGRLQDPGPFTGGGQAPDALFA
jgi:hypothetical protein